MKWPMDKRLDANDLDALMFFHSKGLAAVAAFTKQALVDSQRHVESCRECQQRVQLHKYLQDRISGPAAPGKVLAKLNCPKINWLELVGGTLPTEWTRVPWCYMQPNAIIVARCFEMQQRF